AVRVGEVDVSTWWLAVCIGGPIRPTGAALLERSVDGSATLHSAIRLDTSGLSEDQQAAAIADQVAERAAREPLVVILARAAGVGRVLDKLWREAMTPRTEFHYCLLLPCAPDVTCTHLCLYPVV